MNAGQLYVVAGPIGNLNDISQRLRDVIAGSDLILAEDTRITGKLLQRLEISKPMSTLNEHTHATKIATFRDRVAAGETLAILTDAGTPAISDPGSILVDLCLDADLTVTPIPGPSAVTTALSASGFFAQRYAFLGFLPRKPGPVKKLLEPFVDSSFTLVFFESPHRFTKTLALIAETLGPRRYVIARELTKLNEQIYRQTFPHIPTEKDVPAKGEFTIVIEGSRKHRELE
ncbi:16S rRNA (cytidine(1402)-2'-O)-methyltransferase [Armatimonadetes bacterium Uphvl-Ar1]|nr:16S rRNA (cytidine(1402)-2'-O)-methyltransferase [Armatimonadetes bacterium Uphvl-Ar1]